MSGDLDNASFSHQRISQRAVRTSVEKQLDPRGQVQLFLGGCLYKNF